MADDVLEKLLHFISHNFMVEPEEIDLDKSLVDQGIIDSFGLVEVSAFLKTQHGIEVGDQDMTRENFGSVHKIVGFVRRRLPR